MEVGSEPTSNYGRSVAIIKVTTSFRSATSSHFAASSNSHLRENLEAVLYLIKSNYCCLINDYQFQHFAERTHLIFHLVGQTS